MIGGLFTLYALVTGGVDTGWTFYTPFSTVSSTTNVIPTALGIFITGFSSILTGLNFIVTIHRMRAPGHDLVPACRCSSGRIYATQPDHGARHAGASRSRSCWSPPSGCSISASSIRRSAAIRCSSSTCSGSIRTRPSTSWCCRRWASISELVAAFCRKPVFGYTFVAFASLGIAVLGFLVWGHHMFVAGQSVYAALVFSILSFLVAIPSAVKVFNWTATMYKGSISWETPMLYAIGFIGLFTIGGLTGCSWRRSASTSTSPTPTSSSRTSTTSWSAARSWAISAACTTGGRRSAAGCTTSGWRRSAPAIIFIGFNLTFFPQFILGYLGMPRRYHAYPPEFQVLNVLSSAGASILGVGYLIPMIYLMWSLRYGKVAGSNPWGAVGLEWTTTSPPPTENFAETPIVTWDAYDYPTPVEGHVA